MTDNFEQQNNVGQDVNTIQVTISDQKTPIVILFGPPASGKTMVLLRMIRYFSNNHYKFRPDRLFRGGNDADYERLCDEFENEKPFANTTPGGTKDIEFLLFTIRDSNSHSLFQFLEAPGEHYYNGKNVQEDFPVYIETIIGLTTPKTWVILLELDWGTVQDRTRYVRQVGVLKDKMSPDDKIIFLFNKADKRKDLFADNGKPNQKAFVTEIENQYPGLLNQFDRGWFYRNPEKLCFSAGGFKKTLQGEQWVYKPSDDWYCSKLLDALV